MERFSTIQQINSSIMFGSFTNEELNSIVSAVTFARAQLLKQAKISFVRGTKVKFTSSKTGQIMTGEVSDVKRKFIHVRTNQGIWRVPANMLSAA